MQSVNLMFDTVENLISRYSAENFGKLNTSSFKPRYLINDK